MVVTCSLATPSSFPLGVFAYAVPLLWNVLHHHNQPPVCTHTHFPLLDLSHVLIYVRKTGILWSGFSPDFNIAHCIHTSLFAYPLGVSCLPADRTRMHCQSRKYDPLGEGKRGAGCRTSRVLSWGAGGSRGGATSGGSTKGAETGAAAIG